MLYTLPSAATVSAAVSVVSSVVAAGVSAASLSAGAAVFAVEPQPAKDAVSLPAQGKLPLTFSFSVPPHNHFLRFNACKR